MKIEVFEKARELGEEIAASEEFRRLQRAQSAYDSDTETQSCLSRVEELMVEIDEGIDDFMALKQLEQLKTEVSALKEQIAASRALMELREANTAFNGMMDEVNQVISFVITGEAADAYHGGGLDAHGCSQVH
jgi:cell fate (sporulation/competence/biofilm development) regulator YlbF (YheA/YmcA/DUF963 family)